MVVKGRIATVGVTIPRAKEDEQLFKEGFSGVYMLHRKSLTLKDAR